jgi:RNA polymerase sigma-70 factor (ECF subfamily)
MTALAPVAVGPRIAFTVNATPTSAVSADERRLVDGLRAGDEAAFVELLRTHGPAMLRIARSYVSSQAVAEEVVQEAWVGVLRGIDRFEGRASLKTWLYRILANTAKTRAVREGRSVPFSALSGDDPDEPAVDPERFQGPDGRLPGNWAAPPPPLPEQIVLDREARAHVEAAVELLPEAQRIVITMRDVAGLDGDEVCEVLGLSQGNQRVLLHRARAKVRTALESYIEVSS